MADKPKLTDAQREEVAKLPQRDQLQRIREMLRANIKEAQGAP